MRSKLNHETRSYFNDNGFLEVETPFMVRYTPGGARNFLVPSRLYGGQFYALAESPQGWIYFSTDSGRIFVIRPTGGGD